MRSSARSAAPGNATWAAWMYRCGDMNAQSNLARNNGILQAPFDDDGFALHVGGPCGTGLFKNNTAINNFDTGLWADTDYVPGLGNVATGNGDNGTYNLNVAKNASACV